MNFESLIVGVFKSTSVIKHLNSFFCIIHCDTYMINLFHLTAQNTSFVRIFNVNRICYDVRNFSIYIF